MRSCHFSSPCRASMCCSWRVSTRSPSSIPSTTRSLRSPSTGSSSITLTARSSSTPASATATISSTRSTPHQSVSLVDELNRCGVDERDVQLIVNSHLHFDHCGQNHALSCPIAVQHAELEAARQPHYTVDDWAAIPEHRMRVLDGDTDLSTGVQALLTPGHTPGHQAIVINSTEGVVLIAAQCIFRRDAWNGGIEAANLHDDEWRAEAAHSVARLQALHPRRVLLSHDHAIG